MNRCILNEECCNKKDLELLDRIRNGKDLVRGDIISKRTLPSDNDFVLTSHVELLVRNKNSKRLMKIIDELKQFSNLSYYKNLVKELEEELGLR